MLDKPELPEFNSIANYVAEYFEDNLPAQGCWKHRGPHHFYSRRLYLAVTLIDRPVPWSQLEALAPQLGSGQKLKKSEEALRTFADCAYRRGK